MVTGGGLSGSAGPRPSYWTHAVDDSGPGGNGDGILDPGETAVLPVTLLNAGDADATSVLGTLYSASPDVLKVYRSTAPYADIVVDDQEISAAPHYEVTLEPGANCGDWIGASIGVAGDGFEVGSGFIMDVGVYDRLKSTLAMLKIVAQSEAELEAGKVVSQKDAFARAEAAVRRIEEDG